MLLHYRSLVYRFQTKGKSAGVFKVLAYFMFCQQLRRFRGQQCRTSKEGAQRLHTMFGIPFDIGYR